MFTNPGFTLADQMFWIVDLFLKTLTQEAGKRPIAGWLWGAIRNRVGRLSRRFCALYGQWKAGTLPKAGVRAVATPHLPASRAPSSPARGEGEKAMDAGLAMSVRPASLLPRGLRWMQGMLPWSAGVLASRVSSLVDNHPEMRAFVADCPEAGRILRPLLRMAGLHPPAWLALAGRRRKRWASPTLRLSGEDEAALARMTARFPDTPPARAAKRALRRMFAGKPVDVTKLSAVAYGYFVHPPRDGNCPPPEIGYGGRLFPPPPKDYVRPKEGES